MTKPPAGSKTIVRWTMILRRPKRSVDLQRCAEEVCHALYDAHFAARMPEDSCQKYRKIADKKMSCDCFFLLQINWSCI